MKALLLAAVLVLAPVGPSGCASDTPVTTYGTVNEAFISAQDLTISLRAAGKIDDETYVTAVMPALLEANAALDKWGASVQAGKPVEAHKLAYQASLRTLQRVLAQIQAKHGSNQ